MVLNHGERRGGRDVYLPPRQGALRPSVPPPWIDRQSPIPMYYQIMNQLREKISAGEYTVDSALPPERELVESYQVSRMTIRQAISELVNEGILVGRRGIGTFVAPPKIEQPLNRLTSFTEDMAQRGMQGGSRRVSFKEIVPGPAVRKTRG